MNLAKKGLIVFCAVLIAAMPTNLFAVELTEEQIGNISSNCSMLAGLGLPGAQASAAAVLPDFIIAKTGRELC